MAASAAFTLDAGATLVKAAAAASAAVDLALVSTDGVSTVLWSIIATSDEHVPGDFVIADSSANPTTVTMPNAACACIVRCTVNGGVQIDNATGISGVGDLIKTAKAYVATDGGMELLCAGEQMESDSTHGYAVPMNGAIRAVDGLMFLGNALLTGTDDVELFSANEYDPAGGAFTATLPAIVNGAGVSFAHTGASTNAFTINGSAGGGDIEGSATRAWSTVGARFSLIAINGVWRVFGTAHD